MLIQNARGAEHCTSQYDTHFMPLTLRPVKHIIHDRGTRPPPEPSWNLHSLHSRSSESQIRYAALPDVPRIRPGRARTCPSAAPPGATASPPTHLRPRPRRSPRRSRHHECFYVVQLPLPQPHSQTILGRGTEKLSENPLAPGRHRGGPDGLPGPCDPSRARLVREHSPRFALPPRWRYPDGVRTGCSYAVLSDEH